MIQFRRIVEVVVLSGALLLLPGRANAQNGALKVTSFPSGANVAVDGVDTGKVTPMNINLSVGTHAVRVSIPDLGWNVDTRTVVVDTGNNDLSVTLWPILTVVPIDRQGPPGRRVLLGHRGPLGLKVLLGHRGLQVPLELTTLEPGIRPSHTALTTR